MQSIMESVANTNFSSVAATVRSCSQHYFKQLSIVTKGLTERLKVVLVDLGDLEEWVSLEGGVYCALIFAFIIGIFFIFRDIYRKIRYSIPATVNCWFCNCNTKVLYSLRETWTCPKCHQYNGFTADGNYNKRIPAQFIEALNRPIRGGPAKDYLPKNLGSNSNGLCSQCNLNQVLKVFQLASFVPVNDRNFDAEIEAEQKRLEQLYDICEQCKCVVQETLKRTPEKQQVPIRRKIKVNKVVPNPPKECSSNSTLEELERSYQDFQKGRSRSSDNDSADSFLSLDNLQINSNNRNYEEFHLPPMSSPRLTTPSRLHSPRGHSSAMYSKNSPTYGSTLGLNKEMPSLWRDYPMVQNGLSPAFSVMDSMSVPVGRPAYISYNASIVSPTPSHFNYQSSNVGTVFGGRKPLVSPPKFNVGASHFTPYVRYGAYYDVSSVPSPGPVMLNSPQFFTNPISRSSSQSSGFVSQHGGVSTPTQQQSTNSGGLYM